MSAVPSPVHADFVIELFGDGIPRVDQVAFQHHDVLVDAQGKQLVVAQALGVAQAAVQRRKVQLGVVLGHPGACGIYRVFRLHARAIAWLGGQLVDALKRKQTGLCFCHGVCSVVA